jgi:hypothetical protein
MGAASGLVSLALIALLGIWVMYNRSRNDAAFTSCFDKGVAYLKAVGSYPDLSTGESATGEVIDRCKRLPTAFDGLEDVR